MKTHDAAGRISRFNNAVIGGPYRITNKDIAVLQLLQRYRYLPSQYVPALLGWTGNYYQDVLRKLRHTVGALFVPKHSWPRGTAAHARAAVYALTPKGERILKERGLYVAIPKTGHELDHELGVCLVRASFELGAREHGLELRGPQDILDHPKCPTLTRRDPDPWGVPVSFTWKMLRGRTVPISQTVRSDGEFFVLGRSHEKGRTTLAFPGFEFDRSTETLVPGSPTATAIEKKFAAFRAIASERSYKSRYELPNNIISFITINEQRKRSMMRVVDEITKGRGSKLFIFKSLPDFSTFEGFPPPTGHMLTEDWLRVGKGGVPERYNILEELGVV